MVLARAQPRYDDAVRPPTRASRGAGAGAYLWRALTTDVLGLGLSALYLQRGERRKFPLFWRFNSLNMEYGVL